MAKIRALVVDDNARFALAAENFLGADARIEVLSSAPSGEDALRRMCRDHPDLVLMDVQLPGMDGFEATRRIKGRTAAPKVVMISLEDGNEARVEAHRAGADAFVSKARIASALMPLIERLFELHEAHGLGRRPFD